MYLLLILFIQISLGQQCQFSTESFTDYGNDWQLFYSHKLLTKDIKQIFENQIRKEEVVFTDYSQMDKQKFCNKKTPLIFLFCTISNHEDIIIAVYNKNRSISFGHYYFFKINENKDVVASKEIAMLEMICDPSSLERIVENETYDPKLSQELLSLKLK